MDKSKQDKTKKVEPKRGEPKKIVFPFNKQNYILLFIGLGFLALGFILMIGGGSDDPKVFSYAIFDFQRLTLAPILLAIGYLIEIFAIMRLPKEKKSPE